jgi:hypothetical protein
MSLLPDHRWQTDSICGIRRIHSRLANVHSSVEWFTFWFAAILRVQSLR